MKLNLFYKILFMVMLSSVYMYGADSSSSTQEASKMLDTTSVTNNIIIFLTAIGSLVTIIAFGSQFIKPKQKKLSPTMIDKLNNDYKEIEKKVKLLTDENISEKVKNLQQSFQTLDSTVSDIVKNKISVLSENVTKLDQKLTDLNKFYETALNDRKEENRQIKQEINTLRENIREDINDVKNIIMKLMLVLKSDDD